MNKPGIDNYKFGQKNHWRRTVWNEIASRVKDKRNARVIYLAGEQNLDCDVACSKGFRKNNMIAVEIDPGRTRKLRSKGVNTINGDLMEVIYNWPEKHKVDVIVADFCFGFEAKAVDLYDSICSPALVDSVCLVNFQRGRDSSTNGVREYIGNDAVFASNASGDTEELAPSKHRAAQYLRLHAREYVDIGPLGKFAPEIFRKSIESSILAGMNPKFYSYKSGRVYMDSAVFQHNLSKANEKQRALLTETQGWHERYAPDNRKLKSRITAAIAVQSMRCA